MREMKHGTTREGVEVVRGPRSRVSVLLTLVVAVGVIGFLAGGSIARSATQTNATVSLHRTRLGSILVTSRGHTLYLFARDRRGKSSCNGSCAKFWPPLLSRGAPTAGPGVKQTLLAMTRRSDGRLQVTYNRHPLYTYVRDRRAGQTNGEGSLLFGARWWAVSARGTAVVKAPTTTTSTTTTTPTTTSSCLYPPCP